MTETEAFATLHDEIQTFHHPNQLLCQSFTTLEEKSRPHDPCPLPVPIPELPYSSTLFPTSFHEPKIHLPPEFNRKVSEYAMFLDHCEFYFDNKSSMFFNNEKSKVSLVISHICGRAAAWAHALCRTGPANPVFLSWPVFKALMNSQFGNTYYLEQVHHDFHALKQKGSGCNFFIQFKTFASIL